MEEGSYLPFSMDYIETKLKGEKDRSREIS